MKLLKLVLASLLLAGCSNTPKPEPTPTVTPEPTAEATPEVVKNITEGYIQIERDGECYWDEEGNFIHGHELSFDEFLKDFVFANIKGTEDACKALVKNQKSYLHFKNNNGEIPNGNGPYQKYGYYDNNEAIGFVESIYRACPETIEEVENYTE